MANLPIILIEDLEEERRSSFIAHDTQDERPEITRLFELFDRLEFPEDYDEEGNLINRGC